MEAPERHEQAAPAPGTLGDVLYARPGKARVAEAEWVDLVRRIAAADPAALHALYERAHALVFTLALRITRDPAIAEEVTVDVFHDAWRRASSYDPANGTVLGWIMNQARSRAIDRLRFERRVKRQDPQGEPTEEPQAADPRELLEQRQEGLALAGALEALNPAERQAIECAFVLGMTHVEVAARLGEPLGTVKTRIRAGLGKMRRALETRRTP